MGNGKRGVAPCGHEGEAVIGQFYICLKGCDKVAYEPDFLIIDLPRCECGSYDVDEEFELDPMFYYFNPGAAIVDTRCNTCGRCWTRK